jgi:hypothetical protein
MVERQVPAATDNHPSNQASSLAAAMGASLRRYWDERLLVRDHGAEPGGWVLWFLPGRRRLGWLLAGSLGMAGSGRPGESHPGLPWNGA